MSHYYRNEIKHDFYKNDVYNRRLTSGFITTKELHQS
jgi:hypothetical protein